MKTSKLAVMFLIAGGVVAGGGAVQEASAQMPLSNPLHPANPLNPIYHQESTAEKERRLERERLRQEQREQRRVELEACVVIVDPQGWPCVRRAQAMPLSLSPRSEKGSGRRFRVSP